MVRYKKCRFCYQLANNFLITEEYFGKDLVEIVKKTIGINVEPFNLNGVLICENCALSLIQLGCFSEKFKNEFDKIRRVNTSIRGNTSIKTTPKVDKEDNNESKTDETIQIQFRQSQSQKISTEKINAQGDGNESDENEENCVLEEEHYVENGDAAEVEDDVKIENFFVKLEKKGKLTKKTDTPKKQSINKSAKTVAKSAKIPKLPKKNVKKANNLSESMQETAESECNVTSNNDNVTSNNDNDTFTSLIAAVSNNSATKKNRKNNSESFGEFDTNALSNGFKKFKTEESLPNKMFGSDTDMDLSQEGKKKSKKNSTFIENSAFKCYYCDKDFVELQKLLKHASKHHANAEENTCPNCGSNFKTEEKYNAHISGRKCEYSNWECEVLDCRKRFTSLDNRNKHLAKKHAHHLKDIE